MALTHLEKRGRIIAPRLADLGLTLLGAAAYAVVGWGAGLLIPQWALFRPTAAILTVVALLGGPVVGFGAGFLGDLVLSLWQGSVWLHWSLGAGVAGLILGLLWLWSDLDATPTLTRTDFQKIAFFCCAAFFAGSFLPAAVDVALGAALSLALLVWAIPMWLTTAFWGTVLGTILLILWKQAAGRLAARATRQKTVLRRG